MKTISITAMRRPELLARLFDTLLANDLSGYTIAVAIEPSERTREVLALCQVRLSGRDHRIVVNDAVLGVRANPYHLLRRVFEDGSAFNLYLEEDLEIAPDTTRLAEWYVANHRPEWLCLNLLAGPCGSAAMLSDPGHPDELVAARTFNSLGFAVRREEWHRHLEPIWMGGMPRSATRAPPRMQQWGWDWSIHGYLAQHRDKLVSIQPILARATHTGRLGTSVTPEFHDQAFAGLPLADGTATGYALTGHAALPHRVRSLLNAQAELTAHRVAQSWVEPYVDLIKRLRRPFGRKT